MSTYLTKRLNKKHFLSLAKFDTTFNKLTIYRKIRKFKNLSWFNSKKTQLSSKLTVLIWKPKRVIICKKLLKNLGIDIDLRYYLYYYCYSFTICLFLFFSFFFSLEFYFQVQECWYMVGWNFASTNVKLVLLPLRYCHLWNL